MPTEFLNRNGIVLVTGGNGFIGSYVAERLRSMGYHVRIVDISPKSYFAHPAPMEELVGDLCDIAVCRRAVNGVNTVLHFAAVMGGMGTIHESNELAIYRSNHGMLLNLLVACAEAGVKSFFLASSACVYPEHLQTSNEQDVSLCERDVWSGGPPAPQGLYGLEKLSAENLLRMYSSVNGLDIRIARFHNVYGPKGAWSQGREKVPAALLRKAIAAKLLGDGNGTMEIWGDGTQRRSFLWIEDAVNAVVLLLASECREPVNVGSDHAVSIKDLARIAMTTAGGNPSSLALQLDIGKPQGVASRNANNDFIRAQLDWEPNISLESGMTKTAKWIEEEMLRLIDPLNVEERSSALKSFQTSHVVELASEATTFAILLPITSRFSRQPGDCLENLSKFADSLIKTTWRDTQSLSAQFRYRVYLIIDHDDSFLLKQSKAETLLLEKGVRDCTTLICNQPRGHICALWRESAERAWRDGCDYLVLMGDDVELLDEGWMRDVHAEFASIAGAEGVTHGLGCVAFTDTTFPGMPTFPVIHRTHMDIFDGKVVPDIFINQGGDPYLFQLYRRFGASRMIPSRVQNAVGGSEDARYEKHTVDWTFEVLDEGTARLEAWLGPQARSCRRLTLDIVVPSYRVQLPYLDRILQLKPSPTCSVMFIIIIDDPSSPNVALLEKKHGHRPDVRIRVNKTNIGASLSRNRGMRESSAEWVHSLDDDVIPDPDLLVEGEKVIRSHPNAAGFVGNTQLPLCENITTTAIHFAGVTYFWDIATKIEHDVPWGVTANLMFRRNVRDGIAYDPSFPKTGGGEDIDFCLRKRDFTVGNGGEGFWAAPRVVVTHPWWHQGQRSYWRFYRWAGGDGALVKMYPEHTYSGGALNGGEMLLSSMVFVVLTATFGAITNDWRFAFIALKTIVAIVVANVLYDIYRHVWRNPERVKDMKTTVHGVNWILAMMEGTMIRMASESGRVMGMIERREFGHLGRRFDWFVGRVGPGPRSEERAKCRETLVICVLILALLLARV
ncbi:hypothetical protein HWV62_39513 [Athelia sp. TMB]|nr:hypothetical protein HWV62_39513 [Athelia sp. TMB]